VLSCIFLSVKELLVQIPSTHYDVIILGAGASGLLCAFTAAHRKRRVLVLEKSNKPGKKILMSGGGRCNFTNYFVEPDNFLSRNPHFSIAALNRYTQWDFIELVNRHGIEYEERKHSQLFCLHSARDILTMLLDECAQAGVEIRTQCEIDSIEALDPSGHAAGHSASEQHSLMTDGPPDPHLQADRNGGYRLHGIQKHAKFSLTCQSLVVATGALSVPTLGGSGLGYEIARQFGLAVTERRAGLVPFMFTDALKSVCERLSGIALEAEVSCNGRSFRENLLFTHRGMSGPVILQISSYWHPGDVISIDLLPGLNAADWLVQARHREGKGLLRTLLHQKLPKGLVAELQALWWPDKAEAPLGAFNEKQLTEIGNRLNQWQVKPSATEGYRTAEVTLGGVDTDGISSKTMEAKAQPGLYFVGEVLDVTGHLGGFNFQWAWSSGYSAGLFV
jgi:predicted flavoprotein YhiN